MAPSLEVTGGTTAAGEKDSREEKNASHVDVVAPKGKPQDAKISSGIPERPTPRTTFEFEDHPIDETRKLRVCLYLHGSLSLFSFFSCT